MRRVLHVVSDLHLGGAPAGPESSGFQMCPPESQRRLATWIDRLPAGTPDCISQLLIAGDIVDFLAEEPFEAFTVDIRAAIHKLDVIVARTECVWAALRRFATQRGGTLTLMIGNHDVELSLPGVRERLIQHLGGGPIEFIVDNQAFTAGPVLVEHGNRFDAWNAVPHGALRRARSQLSRRRAVTPPFPAIPGSRLVVDVMNPLKRKFPFIDLLKPEDAAALPLAAALGATGISDVWKFFLQFRNSLRVDYDEEGEPLDESLISDGPATDDRNFALAQHIQDGGECEEISSLRDRGVELRHELVLQALRACRSLHRKAFDIAYEADTYLVPARAAAAAGFKVIVYGHTHLAKCVRLGSDDLQGALYLNTGTWADLMGVPEGLWDEDIAVGRETFGRFAGDLGQSALTRWRRNVPTFARIRLGDDEQLIDAGLFFADTDEQISTEGLCQRMQVAASVHG